MPEFILNTTGFDEFAALDDFTQGYIEAMFFTSTGYQEDDDLETAVPSEFAPETIETIKADCAKFKADNHVSLFDAIRIDDYDDSQAGRDYWYTRNGHGAGFWDRGLGDVGEALTKSAQYNESSLYRGDDGKLYLFQS